MERISVNAYAKINLSINVTGKQENGYHQVEMVMQQVDLSDLVEIQWNPGGSQDIILTCSLPYLPIQEDNIAFRAARLMLEECGMTGLGTVEVRLNKRIPVAAGLAGGSADGAAVLHGLNRLWEKDLPVEKLMELGGRLGADVPFCIMGQASLNSNLGFSKQTAPISSCALACGIGTELTPLPAMKGWIVLSKPPISVSTPEVYGGLRLDQITDRPNTSQLIQAIRTQNWYLASIQMKNVLEQVTLKRYPQVKRLMETMQTQCSPYQTRMSGSGPTVFGLFLNREKAQKAFRKMKELHRDTYLARLL